MSRNPASDPLTALWALQIEHIKAAIIGAYRKWLKENNVEIDNFDHTTPRANVLFDQLIDSMEDDCLDIVDIFQEAIISISRNQSYVNDIFIGHRKKILSFIDLLTGNIKDNIANKSHLLDEEIADAFNQCMEELNGEL